MNFDNEMDLRHVCALEQEYVRCSYPTSLVTPSIRAAVAFSNKAVDEDKKQNYKEAIKYYKECQKHYLHAIGYDIKNDATKEVVREKLKKYKNRLEILTSYMEKISKIDQQE